MSRELSEWFWNPNVWLPPNITWADIQSNETVKYAEFDDLYHPLPMAFMFLVLRFFVEKFVWAPVGRSMGLKAMRPKRVAFNEILEEAYRKSRRVSHKQVREMARTLDWSERQVDRWLRLRKLQDSPNKLTRFTETGWQFTYYLVIFSYGLHTLWDKAWFWEIRHCFYNMPFHPIDDDVWWYYMLSLSFYWSMTLRHFFDVKHKDFWEMLLHHVVTISLLSFSWACNFTRIGTLVLIVHDVSDIFLLGAKMFKYLNLQMWCDVTFAVFVLIWIVTRLGVYPGWILYSTTIDATYIVQFFPAYYIFNGMMLGLLVLHCIWTYYILLMAYQALHAGQITGDSRSDSSEEVSSSSEENKLPEDAPAATNGVFKHATNAAATGDSGATSPGDSGATSPGDSGATSPGDSGATSPDDSGATSPGDSGATAVAGGDK